ncbi:MAG: 2-oxoacid:acceptor oxidoreductase family protein [Phycisphaerae bacterium]|nr:2-oxoacid:acceptor oxidoreductase family protein [Phycisphaerae bacterium]
MKELRLHGRGGQGAVTSAELVATSAIRAGHFAQAFPSFGPERRGAPVMAYARVSEQQIRNRSAVYEPDMVLVLDPSLLKIVDVCAGLKPDGILVLNTGNPAASVRKEFGIKHKLVVVDALTIALATLRRPITNTTLLGAFNKAAAVMDNEFFFASMKERFGPLAARNIEAFKRAYETTEILEAE